MRPWNPIDGERGILLLRVKRLIKHHDRRAPGYRLVHLCIELVILIVELAAQDLIQDPMVVPAVFRVELFEHLDCTLWGAFLGQFKFVLVQVVPPEVLD